MERVACVVAFVFLVFVVETAATCIMGCGVFVSWLQLLTRSATMGARQQKFEREFMGLLI